MVMPETAASPSTRNRPSKQYRCNECGKPFDSAETLDTANLAILNPLQE
ncbi:MAG TPA: hypothetical protein VKA95_00650 [Nitrososphaeraceae archaeon]|nr:hypothetical protein [Nitrososphaeraceae archaeon]